MPRDPATRAQQNEEKQILEQALKAFEETTATSAAVALMDLQLPQGIADAEVQLGKEKPLVAEVKRNLTPATLGQALAQFRRFERPGLLVARYVTPQMAERLKALDVAFLDTAGNAYVRTPKMFIYITGRKPVGPEPAERPVRAFRAAGLKVVFALLCRPELVAAPYREIAEHAGAALGTVNWVIKDLKRLGYLHESRAKGRVIENCQGLVDAWVETYSRELRPRLKPRRFKVADPEWWKKENLAALDMWLGGEAGAALLTKYLRPEIVTVYGDTHFATLARRIRPVKDDYGKLEVLAKFWNFDPVELVAGYRLAPPLLIYADLVATADARNVEAAELIRERFLA